MRGRLKAADHGTRLFQCRLAEVFLEEERDAGVEACGDDGVRDHVGEAGEGEKLEVLASAEEGLGHLQ